jgi:hypothetical protein
MLTVTILSDEDIFEFVRKRKFNITGFREENLTLNGHKGGGGCSPNPRRR